MGLLTTAQAAEQLGVTGQAVRNWVRDGKLRTAHESPAGYLFREADIVRLAAKRAKR